MFGKSAVSAALLLAALVLADREPSGHVFREHSLAKPFLTSGMAIPYWDFLGNAVVSEEFIRLTPDRQAKKGAIWNNKPNSLPEWELTIQFAVHGQGKHLFGDGFAIWYVAQPGVIGNVFGSKDRFSGLGVFFDTYSNHKAHNHGYPYVSAMVNDGSQAYDHEQDGANQAVPGCQSFFRNAEHDTLVRIIYRNRALTVFVDTKDRHEWELCFSVPDVFLPTGYYFGASAATGDLADNHDILSFKLSENGEMSADEEAEVNAARERMGQGHDEHHQQQDEYHEPDPRQDEYRDDQQEHDDRRNNDRRNNNNNNNNNNIKANINRRGRDEHRQDDHRDDQDPGAYEEGQRRRNQGRRDPPPPPPRRNERPTRKPFSRQQQQRQMYDEDQEDEDESSGGGFISTLIWLILVVGVLGGVGFVVKTKLLRAKEPRYNF